MFFVFWFIAFLSMISYSEMGAIDEEGDFEEETESGDDVDWDSIIEQRMEEKMALEAIYGDKFCERIDNRVWTLSLDLPKLTSLASEHTGGVEKKRSCHNQKVDPSVCKYYLKGHCRFGRSCKFKHEVIYQQTDKPVSTEEVGVISCYREFTSAVK